MSLGAFVGKRWMVIRRKPCELHARGTGMLLDFLHLGIVNELYLLLTADPITALRLVSIDTERLVLSIIAHFHQPHD
jgi:hypothetical protein